MVRPHPLPPLEIEERVVAEGQVRAGAALMVALQFANRRSAPTARAVPRRS